VYFHISRVHHEVFVLRDAKNILSPPGWFMLHPRPGKSRGRTIFDRGFSSLGKQATPKHREALRSEPVFQIWWHRTLGHSSLVDAWRSKVPALAAQRMLSYFWRPPYRRHGELQWNSDQGRTSLAAFPRPSTCHDVASRIDAVIYQYGHRCHAF